MTSKSMLEKTGIEKSCRIKSENVIGRNVIMKVSYHGHSVVKIETNGKVILIDPF